ncbi:MAG: DUF167 domain-containing protein [Rhodospirillales bacterium]|nr:DUF167 domain-containing protein [Rhodospirillales bacterium]
MAFAIRLPLSAVADGVVVVVKLAPKSHREGIEGVATEPGARGPEAALKIRVAAPPEDGKANAALLALLAREWGVPRRALTLIAGATQRLKRVHVRGDPAALLRDLERKIGAP